MVTITSETDKRLIVKGFINNKEAFMLIDTGAVAGIFNKADSKYYDLDISKHRKVELVSATGKFSAYVCNTPIVIGDKTMYQFVVADIRDIVKSIKDQTGITIAGIISLPQMKALHVEIDTDDNFIKI